MTALTVEQSARQPAMPFWARALMALVLLSFLSFFGIGLSVIPFVHDLAVNSTSPAYIARVAQEIAHFPRPLPGGYGFQAAISLLDQVAVLLAIHKTDEGQLVFVAGPGQSGEPKDAKVLLDRAYDLGIYTLNMSAKFGAVKRKGEEDIAGQKLYWEVGELRDITFMPTAEDAAQPAAGKRLEGFVGCIRLKETGRKIFIYGFKPKDGPYDLDETLSVLKSISGF